MGTRKEGGCAEEDEKENEDGGRSRDRGRRMSIMVVTCPRALRGGERNKKKTRGVREGTRTRSRERGK